MPKKVRTPVPDVAEVMANGGIVTRAGAAALIVNLHPDKDRVDDRYLRDRVRKQINARIESGAIIEARPNMIRLDEVAELARETWPDGNYDNLPRVLTPGTGHLQTRGSVPLTGQSTSLPATVKQCNRVIRDLEAEVSRLTNALRECKQHIADLEPDALKYRANREKNRNSARKPRRR